MKMYSYYTGEMIDVNLYNKQSSASWGEVFKGTLPWLATGTALALVPAGLSYFERKAKERELSNKADRAYGEMFNIHPSLKAVRKAREKEIRLKFDVLKEFSPSIAANPVVAGEYILNSLEEPNLFHPQSLKPLVDIQSQVNMQDRNNPTFGQTSMEMFKGMKPRIA